MITAADILAVPLLEGIPETEAKWLASQCEERALIDKDILFEKGKEADTLLVIFEGRITVADEKGLTAFTIEPGEISGKLPYSRMRHYGGTGLASGKGRAGLVAQERFGGFHEHCPTALERLIGMMSDRIRSTTRDNLHEEKLKGLGTMAAGLAHELNNPASAAKRGAQSLEGILQAFDDHSSMLLKQFIFIEPPAEEQPFAELIAARNLGGVQLKAREQGEREDDLADWLEGLGVEDPWEDAAILVSVGYTREIMETFAERLKPEFRCAFAQWIAREIEMLVVSQELIESTTRVADLVATMKSYSYMDRATEKCPVDLTEGIEATLRILQHKWRRKGIAIHREYSEMPKVPVIGGEMNQVWTNLLDNAIHAAPDESGKITVRTKVEGRNALIEFEDNGSGIPEDIQPRIFDPFFTTKGVNDGTGLGLDTTQRIVHSRHGGVIRFTSKPGCTCFQVRLPLE